MNTNKTNSNYFSIHGLTGFAIAVVGLLATMAILVFLAINIQQKEITNTYSIDTNIDYIPANGINQKQYYTN